MESKKHAILVICVWVLLIFSRCCDILSQDIFMIRWFDWFVMTAGVVIILVMIRNLYKEKHNKQ